ncbi:hypothetical protein SLEP1_g41279 [Rubroshorea leprosula]|uniref:Uncharacterized protein n=1 Tax=Rubroshorea leprosula TaxID=152421 RepID=A0AAV5L6N5_9ROSI|nr:hypothetical protein SLEP1_g41279 [Rubroshorea leprosula]
MLESEEDEPTQDLSSLSTSLQQGLSLESLSEDVIRPLLEASDDESGHGDFDKEVGIVELVRCGGDELLARSNGLWELEDEAINY